MGIFLLLYLRNSAPPLMRELFLLAFIFLMSGICYGQNLCKLAKVGMSDKELIELIGKPDSTTLLGVDNGKDSLFLWHYGPQDAMMGGGKVVKLIMDPKKETDLNRQMMEGKLPPLDYEQQMEELKQNSCE
jgi:hypothetical protein